MKTSRLAFLLLLVMGLMLTVRTRAQTSSDNPANLPQRDGSHDFDFLIGDWKAHVRRLPDRLNNSTVWVEYDGISNHHKILDSNANFEEFNVTSTDKKLHIKGQTLRLYNPTSHQWSIYLVDVDNGTLGLPPSSALSPEIAGSFSIRKSTKAGQFSCAAFGSTFLPNRLAWSSLFHRMEARVGRSTGFASFRDNCGTKK
jgi:hypothetical protein